jgi:hypothetical protein
MTDGKGGGVNEADAGARPPLEVQVDGQGHEKAGHEIDEAGVADELWKVLAQLHLDLLAVERFGSAIA